MSCIWLRRRWPCRTATPRRPPARFRGDLSRSDRSRNGAELGRWPHRVRTCAASVRQAAGILRRIMATAVTSGVIPTSPCDGIKLPSNEHRVMRFLEPTQIAELTAAMDKPYQGLVLLGAYGGLPASDHGVARQACRPSARSDRGC